LNIADVVSRRAPVLSAADFKWPAAGNIMSAIRNALAGDAGWHVCVQCADR